MKQDTTQITIIADWSDHTLGEISEIAQEHIAAHPDHEVWMDGDLGALVYRPKGADGPSGHGRGHCP